MKLVDVDDIIFSKHGEETVRNRIDDTRHKIVWKARTIRYRDNNSSIELKIIFSDIHISLVSKPSYTTCNHIAIPYNSGPFV